MTLLKSKRLFRLSVSVSVSSYHLRDQSLIGYHVDCDLENDPLFPDDIREAGKRQLEAKQIKHESKVYSDVPHGRPTF